MKRLWLVAASVFGVVAGCGGGAPPAGARPAAPVGVAAAPGAGAEPAPPLDHLAAPLVPFESAALRVKLAYPQTFASAGMDALGGIKLTFDTGQIAIIRQARPADATLEGLTAESIAVNIQISHGRIVPDGHGPTRLAGHEAYWAKQHFDSAAGRHDWIHYFVLADQDVVVVTCGTKEGPPPIPWATVQPICDRTLTTLRLE